MSGIIYTNETSIYFKAGCRHNTETSFLGSVFCYSSSYALFPFICGHCLLAGHLDTVNVNPPSTPMRQVSTWEIREAASSMENSTYTPVTVKELRAPQTQSIPLIGGRQHTGHLTKQLSFCVLHSLLRVPDA